MKYLKIKAVIISIIVGLAVIKLCNSIFDNPKFVNNEEELQHAQLIGHWERVEELRWQELERDEYNIQAHYNFIGAHFDVAENLRKNIGDLSFGSDAYVHTYYNSLKNRNSPELNDIGKYGLGLISSNNEDYYGAIEHYKSVGNREQKYLNNSSGFVYRKLGQDSLAEAHFNLALEYNGNTSGAILNLSEMYMDQFNTDKLQTIISSQYADFVPNQVKRNYYLITGRLHLYILEIVLIVFRSLNFLGFIGAFGILVVWLLYLRKMDLFEPESWYFILFALLPGIIFPFFTFALSDYNQTILGFKLNGDFFNDFAYSVIGIGMIEEFVKIVPLLILVRYTKIINESYDYIFYASISGLGFAFSENLLYFQNHQLDIISSRALLTSIGHMYLTSIVAYALVLNRYRYRRFKKLRIIVFFMLASVGHGFYDFWLINESVSSFSILSIVFFLSGIGIWNTIMNNALNQSEFHTKNKKLNHEAIGAQLIYGLVGIIFLEYVSLSYLYGPKFGNETLLSSIGQGGVLLVIISNNLGHFRVKKGRWKKFSLFNLKTTNYQTVRPDDVVGQIIKFRQISKNGYQDLYFPNSGKVIDRLEIDQNSEWFLVKLDTSPDSKLYNNKYIIFRPKEQMDEIKPNEDSIVGIYLIDKSIESIGETMNKDEIHFIQWAKTRAYEQLKVD